MINWDYVTLAAIFTLLCMACLVGWFEEKDN